MTVTASNHSAITFGQCTASPGANITHVGIGSATSGAGHLFKVIALSAALPMYVGRVPEFVAGALAVPNSDDWASDLLKHIFQNATLPNVGDSTGLRGSTSAGSFYISLHTASPAGGDQTTSEAAYTGYGRVAVARSSSGWDVA